MKNTDYIQYLIVREGFSLPFFQNIMRMSMEFAPISHGSDEQGNPDALPTDV